MQYLEIILNLPVNQGFTYSYIPPEKEKPELVPQIGKRAEIMFGNKKTEGFIISISDKIPENCPVEASKIRPVKRIIDKEPLFGEELTFIAHFNITEPVTNIIHFVTVNYEQPDVCINNL